MSLKEFDLSDYINALEHFSGIMEDWYSQIQEEMRTEDKFLKLASHKGEDVASEPVQNIIEEIISGTQTTAPKLLVGSVNNYCRMMINTYSRASLEPKNIKRPRKCPFYQHIRGPVCYSNSVLFSKT